eukprot:m.196940 g.196940  ORF g.196940 m.196940 type:complete len:1316 (+) comp17018_c0_seq2:165-4112(+)
MEDDLHSISSDSSLASAVSYLSEPDDEAINNEPMDEVDEGVEAPDWDLDELAANPPPQAALPQPPRQGQAQPPRQSQAQPSSTAPALNLSDLTGHVARPNAVARGPSAATGAAVPSMARRRLASGAPTSLANGAPTSLANTSPLVQRRPLPIEQPPTNGNIPSEEHEQLVKATEPAYEDGLWEGLIEYESTRRKLRMVLGQVPNEHCRLLNLTTPQAADFVDLSSGSRAEQQRGGLLSLDSTGHFVPVCGLAYDSGPRMFVVTGWKSTSAPYFWRLVLQDAHTRCKYSIQGQLDLATRTLNAHCYKLNIGSPAKALGRATLRGQGPAVYLSAFEDPVQLGWANPFIEDLRERPDTPVRSALPAKLLCQLFLAHGMASVATAVVDAQRRRPCDLVTLTSMTPSKLEAYLELSSTTEAFRTMAILDWLLHLRRRAKLAAVARVYCHVPMSDILFRRMSGFERVVTMSYRELAAYLSFGGEEAARASGASIPRLWSQPPTAIAQSVNRLRLHADRMRMMSRMGQSVSNPKHSQPGSGKQLLVMPQAQLRSAGYTPVVDQAFDFFFEYVYYLLNRETLLAYKGNCHYLMGVLVQSQSLPDVYTLLRVQPSSAGAQQDGELLSDVAQDDAVRLLLQQHYQNWSQEEDVLEDPSIILATLNRTTRVIEDDDDPGRPLLGRHQDSYIAASRPFGFLKLGVPFLLLLAAYILAVPLSVRFLADDGMIHAGGTSKAGQFECLLIDPVFGLISILLLLLILESVSRLRHYLFKFRTRRPVFILLYAFVGVTVFTYATFMLINSIPHCHDPDGSECIFMEVHVYFYIIKTFALLAFAFLVFITPILVRPPWAVAHIHTVLILLTLTTDVEFAMYMLKFAPLRDAALGTKAWEVGLIPFWVLNMLCVVMPFLERTLQLDWKEPARPQLEGDVDSEEAVAANTRIPRDSRTRLLSSRSYSTTYGSVNGDDDDAADFTRQFDQQPNILTQLWRTWLEPLVCFPCFPSWERSRESRRQLDELVWVLSHDRNLGEVQESPPEIDPSELQQLSLVSSSNGGLSVYQALFRGRPVRVEYFSKMRELHSVPGRPISGPEEEIRALSGLAHPNVTQLHGTGRVDDMFFLVVELPERGILQQLLDDDSLEMGVEERLSYALDAACGLQYLHSQNPPVVHRNVKPGSLYVDASGTCKVGNFKSARRLMDRIWSDASGVLPASSSVRPPTPRMGTRGFMAPEMCTGARTYGRKVDVYGFGITLWTVWTRRSPYPEYRSLAELEHAVSRGVRPPNPSDSPLLLTSLMASCWDHRVPRRPSFNEVVSELGVIRSMYKDAK